MSEKEIELKAKKSLLNLYYVSIQIREMTVEEILDSIEADMDHLEKEYILLKSKRLLGLDDNQS